MAKRATIRDVARLSGFSTTAVSNTLNNKDARIPESTRRKIREAARRLHYAPNALIRAMHTGRTRVFGLYMDLSSGGGKRFLPVLMMRLETEAAARGHDLLLHCRRADEEEDAAQFLDGRIDGLLFWGPRPRPFLDDLAARQFPVVGLFSEVATPGAARVWADEASGLRDALARLAELGHRELHVPPYQIESPAVALRAQALERLRKEFPLRIRQSRPFAFPRGHRAWLDRLLGAAKPPTAIIPGGVQQGYLAVAIAQSHGLRVPEDVSIVCHEGLDEEDGYGLTSVATPVDDICRAAMDLLLDLVEGREPDRREQAFPTRFVPGRTLAPPRAE